MGADPKASVAQAGSLVMTTHEAAAKLSSLPHVGGLAAGHASFADGLATELEAGGARVQRGETLEHSEPWLAPVLVRNLHGRTGTTVLMHLLGTSSDMEFERTYPFEVRPFAHIVDLANKLQAAGVITTSAGPSSWPPSTVGVQQFGEEALRAL